MVELIQLDANHYMSNCSSQYSQARDLLELVDIKRDASILDVGCGHGHIIAEISQMISEGNAVGVDASKEMIALAQETFQCEAYKNLQYFHASAESMRFSESTFDLIICTNVLMWVREPKKALKLMATFLKPGGNIIVFTYPSTTPYVTLFEETLKELFPELQEKSAVNTMLSPEQHKETLENQGLQLSLFKVEDTTFYYEDQDDFKSYVKGWLMCYAPLTESQQELFLYALCEKLFKKGYHTPNGRFAIPHQTLKLIANKL